MSKLGLSWLAKGSVIYGLGSMLQRFMGLVLLPFFTSVLTPQDFGVIALTSLLAVSMSGLFSLGTSNSLGILYFRETDSNRRPAIIWSNLILLTLNGTFWCFVTYIFAPMISTLIFQSERFTDVIRIAFLGSVLSAIADPWLGYLRMEKKAGLYILITISGSIFSTGLLVWFVVLNGMGVFGFFLANTLSQGIILSLNWLMIGRKMPFHLDPSLFLSLIKIGFPSIFGVFAFLLIDYSDRLMIERLMSLDALGIYSVGYSFAMLMSLVVGAFGTAWPPFFMSYLNKQDEARIIFGKVLTYYLIIFGSLVVIFFSIAKPIVLIFTAYPFYEAYLVIGLVAFGYMLKGCYLIMLPGIYFAEKLYKQSVLEWIAAISNICLNIWLIPLLGILGAALATFVSYLLLPVFAWLVARSYLTVEYEWKRLVKISILVCAASSFLYFLSALSDINLISMILANVTITCLVIGLGYRVLITSSERAQLLRRFR